MSIEYVVERNAESYHARLNDIARLFSEVFVRPFPSEPWGKWYCANPYGNPIVVLAYADGVLIAHNALIPQVFSGPASSTYRYMLSISTMVDKRFRDLSVFERIVGDAHEQARRQGIDLIVGFPNAKSLVPFKVLFGYRTLFQTPLCTWHPSRVATEVPVAPISCVQDDVAGYSYPCDASYWNWRFPNAAARCVLVGNDLQLAYKRQQDVLTVLDAASGSGDPAPFQAFVHTTGAEEVRITEHHARKIGIPRGELVSHNNYTVRLTASPLNGQPVPEIRFSLILSDVF